MVGASTALDVTVCFWNSHCPFLIKWIRKGAGSALQPCWLGACCSKNTRPAPLSQRAASFTGLATQRNGNVQGWAAHHPQWKECTYGVGGECEVLLAYFYLLQDAAGENRQRAQGPRENSKSVGQCGPCRSLLLPQNLVCLSQQCNRKVLGQC